MAFLLWLLAVILIVFGVVKLFQRDFLWGVVLIVVGILIGSFGGVSPF
jgi:hypothetical protein